MNTHNCIKCSTQYQTEDTEAYYCASCDKERKEIAKTIDAKFANRPKRETQSSLQEYDAQPKVMGRFIKVRL